MGFILATYPDEDFISYFLLGWNIYGQKCLFRYQRYTGFELLIKFKNKNSIIDMNYNWTRYLYSRSYGSKLNLYFNPSIQNCYQMATSETYPLSNLEQKTQYYMNDVTNEKNINVESYITYQGTCPVYFDGYTISGIYISPNVIFQNYKFQYDMNGYV
jgi:hypothetical protein